MVGGYITVAYSITARGRYDASVDVGKVLVPSGLEYDIRSSDKMIYVGTLSLKRDLFNEVIDARIVDEFSSARADVVSRFGGADGLRKALPVLLSWSTESLLPAFPGVDRYLPALMGPSSSR